MTAAVIEPTVPGIRIDAVRVGERARKDYGDLASLKQSITDHGLLQPIVLLPDHYLLCGGRRLQACKELGWDSIPFVQSATRDDAISRLCAERDENTCRKDMTPSELIALGKKLEELKRPEVDQRRREGNALGGHSPSRGSTDPRLDDGHKSRREVAEAVGLGESSYARAKRVVETAEDEAAPESVRVAAVQARDAMDAGALSIRAAHEKVSTAIAEAAAPVKPKHVPREQRIEQISELAPRGYTSGQIADELGVGEEHVRNLARENGITIAADKVLNRTRRVRVDHNHLVGHLVMTLEVVTSDLDRIDFSELDEAQMQNWTDSLTTTTRALNRFVKQMKEQVQ